MTLRSSLVDFRALHQVIAYAQEKRHDPVNVVHTAVLGGVVHLFTDLQFSKVQQLLPSSLTMAALSYLIQHGFFVPSQSFSVENAVSRYTPNGECTCRDLVTVITVLFPDCLCDMDAAVQNDAADDEQAKSTSESTPSYNAQRLMEEVNNNNNNNDDQPQQEQHVPVTTISASEDHVLHPATEQMRSGLSHNNFSATGHSQTSGARSISPPAFSNTTGSPTVGNALLEKLHTFRLHVAIGLLKSINDALYDAQLRMQKMSMIKASVKDEAANNQPLAEAAVLNDMTGWLLKCKMLLLQCIFASSCAYRFFDEGTGNGGLEKETTRPKALEYLLFTTPNKYFLHLQEDQFLLAPELWSLPSLGDALYQWYDSTLGRLCAQYEQEKRPNAPKKFEDYLAQLENDIKRDGVAARRPIGIPTHRTNDGNDAVVFRGYDHLPVKLPTLPVQMGELQWMPAPPLLINVTASSSIMATLSLCLKKRLSEGQLRSESHEMFRQPWSTCTPSLQQALNVFLSQEENVTLLLENNAPLLARLVLWGKGASATAVEGNDAKGSSPAVANKEEEMNSAGAASFAVAIEQRVVHTPFNVHIGQYMREVVVQKAITRSLWGEWLCFTCEQALAESEKDGTPNYVFPHGKTVLALVDFTLIHCRWTLSDSEKKIYDAFRQIVK